MSTRIVAINGFSFFGAGQNAGLAFVTLKDWAKRGDGECGAGDCRPRQHGD